MTAWHKRYSRDALNGKRDLSPAERGFYDTALDLIYEEEGPVTDRMIMHEMGVTIRAWRPVKAALLAKGKLYETQDGRISNRRAMFEIGQLSMSSEERKVAGSRGGKARAARDAEARAKAADHDLFDEKLEPSSSRVRGELTANSTGTPREHAEFEPHLSNDFNESDQAGLKLARAQETDTDIREEPPHSGPSTRSAPETVAEVEMVEGEIVEEAVDLGTRRRQPMPPGWEPPGYEELPDRQREMVDTWEEHEFEDQRDKFTAWAEATNARYVQWDRAFHNWIIKHNDMRRSKARGKASGWA